MNMNMNNSKMYNLLVNSRKIMLIALFNLKVTINILAFDYLFNN